MAFYSVISHTFCISACLLHFSVSFSGLKPVLRGSIRKSTVTYKNFVVTTSIEEHGVIDRDDNRKWSPYHKGPTIQIESAPSNSRRIYSSIDIFAPIDKVWSVLTSYDELQKVVPSLVKNEVLQRYSDGGALLAQTGAAKVLPGISFTAKLLVDVRIYSETGPIPELMLSRRRIEDSEPDNNGLRLPEMPQLQDIPLERGVFPRPMSIPSLPSRDITMQNVVNEGDFEHYQAVWRMQQLPMQQASVSPGAATSLIDPLIEAPLLVMGQSQLPAITRLTYAVEIKPKGILPVRLIEGRIASDLRTNMEAIRTYVEGLAGLDSQSK